MGITFNCGTMFGTFNPQAAFAGGGAARRAQAMARAASVPRPTHANDMSQRALPSTISARAAHPMFDPKYSVKGEGIGARPDGPRLGARASAGAAAALLGASTMFSGCGSSAVCASNASYDPSCPPLSDLNTILLGVLGVFFLVMIPYVILNSMRRNRQVDQGEEAAGKNGRPEEIIGADRTLEEPDCEHCGTVIRIGDGGTPKVQRLRRTAGRGT